MAGTRHIGGLASLEPKPLAAAALMLAATACYAAMTLTVRFLTDHVHAFEILFFRNAFGLIIMLPWLLHIMRPGVVSMRRIGTHGLRAGFNALSLGCWFLAVGLIPLTEATAITFTAPLWVTVFAALVLGEVVRVRRWTATLIGFAGVLVILQPWAGESGFDLLTPGALLALGAAAFWALTVITLRTLSRTERPEAVMIWQVLLMAPLTLPAALLFWTGPSLEDLLWMGLIALLATVGQFCHINALRLQDVTALQPIDFVKLPMIAVMALVLFGEVPSFWALSGGIIVFVSASYVSWREAKLKRQRPQPIPNGS